MWESMQVDMVPMGLNAEAEMNDNGEHGRYADDAIGEAAAGGSASGSAPRMNPNFIVENPTIDLETYVQGKVVQEVQSS